MEHLATPDLTNIATITLVVLAGGLVFARLRQPPLVAYILAGALLGPGLELVRTGEFIEALADLGVLMLLFFIGIKIDLSFFRRVWKAAAATTVLEIIGSLAVAAVLGHFFKWDWGLAVFFGFALALSSTAAASQILPQMRFASERAGQMTFAILVAQDLAVAPMIQILSAISALEEGGGVLGLALGRLVASMLLLAALVWWLSRTSPERRLRRFFTALRHNEHLAPVAGIFLCFGAAAAAGWLGLSAAYGAFLAGMVAGNSAGRSLILRQMEPLQVVLVMMFFFAIGLLLDFDFLADRQRLAQVVFALVFVTVVKMTLHMLLLRRLGEDAEDAFVVSSLLSNVGEFAFIIAAVGVSVGLASPEDESLVIVVSALSLVLAPLHVLLARGTHRRALHPVRLPRRRLRRGGGGGEDGDGAGGASAGDGDGRLEPRLGGGPPAAPGAPPGAAPGGAAPPA